MSQSSQQRVGQYNFLRKLGAGRIAEVYLGRIDGAEGFQKPVAIKKILPQLASDPAFVQSLIAEAKIGGQLHHRNIVEVYDFIRYDDEYCIIMEYVEGVDLSRILRAAKQYRIRIPPAAALYIISQICDGLDYAHAARGFSGEPLNIIHRDLKPSNVLISTKGGVKISDFGVARVVEQALQRIGTLGDISDSMYYQSPDQAKGESPLTPASDIFSVGSVFFELLTLENIIPGDGVTEATANLKERDLAKRLALAQRALPGSEKILATALHPNAARRYRSASLMGEDIRRLLAYLRVDDPRERLISFFWRLVRFIREQGKAGAEAGDEGALDERDRDEAWSPMGTQVTGEEEVIPPEDAPAAMAAAAAGLAATSGLEGSNNSNNGDDAIPGHDEHTPVDPAYSGGAPETAYDDSGAYGADAGTYGGGDYSEGGGYGDEPVDGGYSEGDDAYGAYGDAGAAAAGHVDDGQLEGGWDDSDLAATQEPSLEDNYQGPGPNETVLGGYTPVDDGYGQSPDATTIRPPAHVEEDPSQGEPYDPNATYLQPSTPPAASHGATHDFPAATPSANDDYDGGDHTAALPPPSFGGDEEVKSASGNGPKILAAAAIILLLGGGGAFAYFQFGGSSPEVAPPVVVKKAPVDPKAGGSAGDDKDPAALASAQGTPTPKAEATEPPSKPVAVASRPNQGTTTSTRPDVAKPEPVKVYKPTPKPVRATPTPRPNIDSFGSYVAPKAATPTPTRTPRPTPTPTAYPTPEPYKPTPTPTAKPTPVPVKATPKPEAVASVPVDTRSAAEILDEIFGDQASATAKARKGQLTPAEVGALASVSISDEDKYTSSRSYMALHYKATGNTSEYGKALTSMLEVPTNQYNPTIRLEQAEFFLTQKRYGEAIDAASVAERYRQKFPRGEIYYTRLARTYEVLAKSYEGKFTGSEDPEDLDQSIRMWERYMTHVERKSDQQRMKMAKENIEKLERIKERVL